MLSSCLFISHSYSTCSCSRRYISLPQQRCYMQHHAAEHSIAAAAARYEHISRTAASPHKGLPAYYAVSRSAIARAPPPPLLQLHVSYRSMLRQQRTRFRTAVRIAGSAKRCYITLHAPSHAMALPRLPQRMQRAACRRNFHKT